MRPRLLDMFCGGGGAAMGYHRAGFDVVGVDIKPQPDYPFTFFRGNALLFPLDGFDVIHASPPCQTHSRTANLARGQGKQASTIDLIPPTRELLIASGKPYVIENVEGSPLRSPLMLCGSMFDLGVKRHRLFESNVALFSKGPCDHKGQGRPVGVYGSPNDDIPRGGRTGSLEEAREAMGIDWLPWSRLKEAIPPAYTEWIGAQMLDAVVPA